MKSSLEKIADIPEHNDTASDVDDFERMLNDFINAEFDNDINNCQQELDEIRESNQKKASRPTTDDDNDEPDSDTSASYDDAKDLGEHEYSLLRAYQNYIYAINMLCSDHDYDTISLNLSKDMLSPHYKKRAGRAVTKDILAGWDILMAIFPEEMKAISPDSTDDEFLDFAEKCKDDNFQLAIISYVENMIELEGCEIDYEARRLKYERRQIEKEIYEAHQRRVERIKKYSDAIKAKHFPIDADKLVNNYFRLSNKDPEGSFKALTKNPATFAPIDFSKMHDRFFGLIKVKPQDGIRINKKIGEFLKKLKA